MTKQHDYTCLIEWTGDRGDGTRTYRGYDRAWNIATSGKPVVNCSNDPLLGGDPTLHNPEDLLLASLSACHMLWYLHYASVAGIVVTAYRDDPIGIGESSPPTSVPVYGRVPVQGAAGGTYTDNVIITLTY